MEGFTASSWIGLFLLISTALSVDITLFERMRLQGKRAMARNLSLGMWSCLAIGFGLALAFTIGPRQAFDFYRGVFIEGVLSLDNIILLLVTLTLLEPRRENQHRILLLGSLAALFLRAAVVMAGFSAMSSFSWISGALGIILVLVGARGAWNGLRNPSSTDQDPSPSRWGRMLRALRTTKSTPSFVSIFLLIMGLETMNSVLSLDSLSALLVTSDRPFVVFAASMFGTILLRTTARSTQWLSRNQESIAKTTPWILALTGLSLIFPSLLPGWLTATLSLGLFAFPIIISTRKRARATALALTAAH